MSPYKKHLKRWKDCQECPLHQYRHKMVFCRGKLPCDVLVVGEAPGASEDILGKPFCGPAGKLLDRILETSIPPEARVAFTNLVCCIPKDESGKGEPPWPCVLACRPRLQEFIKLAHPQLIICAGLLSQKWTAEASKVPQVSIYHPAFILRMEAVQRPLAIKRCIARIVEAVENVL